MVKIRNIEIKDNILKFDYYPEDKSEKGCAEYSLDRRELVALKQSNSEYEYDKKYFRHALNRVLEAIKDNEDLSGTLTCMWY